MKKRVKATTFIVGLALLLLVAPVLVMAQTAKTTVTIAYNEYFTKTFGPAVPPIDAIKAEVAKKYPNINVQFQVTPLTMQGMHDAYVVWFMAKDSSADILGVAANWTAEFAVANWIKTLEDKVDPALLKQLNPAYLAAHSYQGHLYGLGPWWGGIGGLYYRKDLLSKYGFAAPQTYDDVTKIAKAVVKSNPGMTGWTWPAMDDAVLVNRWTEYLSGFGGKFSMTTALPRSIPHKRSLPSLLCVTCSGTVYPPRRSPPGRRRTPRSGLSTEMQCSTPDGKT